MICFRDKTFCSASVTRCVNTECRPYFGPALQIAANRWWGKGEGAAPVMFSNFEPECDKVIPPPEARKK